MESTIHTSKWVFFQECKDSSIQQKNLTSCNRLRKKNYRIKQLKQKNMANYNNNS